MANTIGTIVFDCSELLEIASPEWKARLEAAGLEASKKLASMTHAHIIEEANKKLHSRRELFIESLHQVEVSADTVAIILEAKAVWIDEGRPEGSMLEDLLKSPKAKTSKSGSRYLVVPFKHGPKGATQMTPAQSTLLQTIKNELKTLNIPYAKIEKNDLGRAKLGKLHSFSILHSPLKTANTPGQGKGPIGAPMQGNTGIPFLQNVNIYQKVVKDKQTGKSKVQRDIMTFRVASSKHEGTGKWHHPGLEATNLLDEGYTWAVDQMERIIIPSLMEKLEQF